MSISAPTIVPSTKPLSDLRTLGPWYFAEFCYSLAVTLYTCSAYFYAGDQLGASPAQRLWLSAGWGAVYIFFALLGGYWADKFGARRLARWMGLGCVATASTGLLVMYVPFLHNLRGLWATMTLFNFTCNQLWPPIESAITRSPGRMRLSTRIAMYNLTWGTSSAIAFFVAPVLFKISWMLIFLGPAGVCLLGSLIITWWAIPQSMIGSQHVSGDDETAEGRTEASRDRILLHMAWVANAVAYAAINVLIPVLPTVVRLAGASSAMGQAVLIFVWTFTRALGFAIIWHWTGWAYSVRWLVGSFLALAITFVVMLAWPANIPLLLAAEVVFGLAAALLYSASLYYAMHVSSGAGGHAGAHESLIGLGIAVGPTIGAMAGAGGESDQIAPGIIISVSCVLAAGLAVLLAMGSKAGPRNPSQPPVEG